MPLSLLTSGQRAWLLRIPSFFEIPVPDPPRLRRRIELMEGHFILPVRAAFIGMIAYSFNFQERWVGEISSTLDVTVEAIQYIFLFYVVAAVLLAVLLAVSRRLPLAVVQWTVVTSCMVDGLFVSGMALITGGLDSPLFWLFVGLILRGSVSLPPGFSQLAVNFFVSLCYVLVASLELSVISGLDDTTRRAFDLMPHEELGEPFVLRLVVLWLTVLCAYGCQAFLERERLAGEEAEEFAAREGQLHAAGRLAAEFAHQIKNPLAIINNAAFSLRRAAQEGKPAAQDLVAIIEEEVGRADRVITQVMGYAQLSEGRVEKLDVPTELDRAVEQVFPAVVPTGITVRREWGGQFPPLLMQRNHLNEAVVNLLQNAREALGDRGTVVVSATGDREGGVRITVADDGPGIAPSVVDRIYEPYYTTKAKGTGLGLAIVKHNVELYAGRVEVESELGKGARFTLTLPAKTWIKTKTT